MTMAATFAVTMVATANSISLTATSGGSTLTGTVFTPGEDIISAGSLNGWNFTVISGSTAPAAGSLSSPYLDLNTVLVTGVGAGNLVVTFSGTDYTLAGGPALSVSGSTLIGTAQAYGGSSDTLADESHALFASPVTLSSSAQIVYGPGVGSSSNPYSLTEVLTITGGAPGSLDEILTVPDGGMTLTMLGTALAGLAAVSSKIGRKH